MSQYSGRSRARPLVLLASLLLVACQRTHPPDPSAVNESLAVTAHPGGGILAHLLANQARIPRCGLTLRVRENDILGYDNQHHPREDRDPRFWEPPRWGPEYLYLTTQPQFTPHDLLGPLTPCGDRSVCTIQFADPETRRLFRDARLHWDPMTGQLRALEARTVIYGATIAGPTQHLEGYLAEYESIRGVDLPVRILYHDPDGPPRRNPRIRTIIHYS